jgi:hypothetical protein
VRVFERWPPQKLHRGRRQTAQRVDGRDLQGPLAVIAYLLRAIDPDTGWSGRLAALLRQFPVSHALTIESMGTPVGWESLELWRG